jgi:hypothetical protein
MGPPRQETNGNRLVTDVGAGFARDYTSAQCKFVAAANARSFELSRIEHPLRGPANETLATDIARLGPADARNVLFLVSGVHGVELYAGSGCQVAFLQNAAALPPDTAIVLVHAINPWGAAHFRRYNEDNVDIARNFLTSNEPRPVNPGYERIHDKIGASDHAAFRANVRSLSAALGEQAMIGALMGGQYVHPNGFSYGGAEPVWSHHVILEILNRHAVAAENVTIVEYHSGLGPYGYGMAVSMQTGEALAYTKEIFGRWVVAPREDNGAPHSVPGHTTDGYTRALAGKQIASIVLEFGTYPPLMSLPVLLDDHWLNFHGDPGSDQGQTIRAQNLEMHMPSDPEWACAIVDRSAQTIRQALRGFCKKDQ